MLPPALLARLHRALLLLVALERGYPSGFSPGLNAHTRHQQSYDHADDDLRGWAAGLLVFRAGSSDLGQCVRFLVWASRAEAGISRRRAYR